jgi:tetratricopeptide (TPR) repeat protein
VKGVREPWTAVLRERPPAEGRCLDEAQLLAFYTGKLADAEAEAVREHLASCRPCLELARDARRFAESMEAPVSEQAGKEAPPPARWPALAAAAAVVVALAAGWWWSRRPAPPGSEAGSPPAPSGAVSITPRNPWADLPIPKVADARLADPSELLWRDPAAEPADPASADDFAVALRAYEQDRFAEAEQGLARLLTRQPGRAEAHFYRGVCLLALGRTEDAIGPLDRAHAAGRGEAREAAAFYLALAHLKAGRPQRALPLLDSISGSPRYRAEAERLRAQVTAVQR